MSEATIPPTLVVHGHFYQPPRENPWTEVVAAEPSASPYHSWNDRITAESYRPNGWARIVDDHDRVVALVNNYEHMSFDAGPTLLAWLQGHAPDVYERMLEADRDGGGAIAQAYGHVILPLANERDVRTQVRWGLADFRHRFGRAAEGMWLPETAVDEAVLAVLAEEGVRFTVLAPGQARRVRPLDADPGQGWVDVGGTNEIDVSRTYRWCHPEDPALGLDLIFYHGALSHDVAFSRGSLSSSELVTKAKGAVQDGGLVCVAADGETFGHHHHFADRALAYALPVAATRMGLSVSNLARFVRDRSPEWQAQVRTSSWSCVHGVERWRSDCGCSTGGWPGASQSWRQPVRDALDLLRDAGTEVFERRGRRVFLDPWAARDGYIDVLLEARPLEDFAAEHVKGDLVEALTLLEQQRHAMAMYASCGWFFWDVAGIETVQVLRSAARCADLLDELSEQWPRAELQAKLAQALSNQPEEGNGAAVLRRHVDSSRVDTGRVVAHLALADLLERRSPSGLVGGFEVDELERKHEERGSLDLSVGAVTLVHRRTRRRSRHVWAALHLGGLEVLGATRPADPSRDEQDGKELWEAFNRGERVTTVLRLLVERFGPREFGLDSALPDAASQIVAGAAAGLAERFRATYRDLFEANRSMLSALASAGYPMPAELRAPAELALSRRFVGIIEGLAAQWRTDVASDARALLRQATDGGFDIATERVVTALEGAVLVAVNAAFRDGGEVSAALGLLELARSAGATVSVERAQEVAYHALTNGAGSSELLRLGVALGLAVDNLGLPPP